jgi:hypothetical protein
MKVCAADTLCYRTVPWPVGKGESMHGGLIGSTQFTDIHPNEGADLLGGPGSLAVRRQGGFDF